MAQVDVDARNDTTLHQALSRALDFGKGLVHVLGPKSERVVVFSTKRACPSCGRSFAELDPRLFSFNSKHGWCDSCFGTGVEMTGFDEEQSARKSGGNEWYEHEPTPCKACDGHRLNPIALNVRFRDQSVASLASGSVERHRRILLEAETESPRDPDRTRSAGRDPGPPAIPGAGGPGLPATGSLRADALGWGSAAHPARSAVGLHLQGVCYVLDEPTIGLHPRDNEVLLGALTQLSGQRNTLVVVEHDEDTIRRARLCARPRPASRLVRGGEVVGAGTVADLIANPRSTTGRFLREPLQHPAQPLRGVDADTPRLKLERVQLHNVTKTDVGIPLGRLVVVTVSRAPASRPWRGMCCTQTCAACSSTATTTARGRRNPPPKPRDPDRLQRHPRHRERGPRVGSRSDTDRQDPALLPGDLYRLLDDIRRIFEGTTEARIRGYTSSRFSFNTAAGAAKPVRARASND